MSKRNWALGAGLALLLCSAQALAGLNDNPGISFGSAASAGGGGAPTGAAGGDLSGTYPNPAVGKITSATSGTFTGLVNNTGAEGAQYALTLGGQVWKLSEVSGGSLYIQDSTNSKSPFVISANPGGSLTLGTTTNALVGETTFSSLVDLLDTSAAHYVKLTATSSSALTADRALTLDLVNAARTLKLGANLTLASDPGAVSGAMKSNGTGTFAQAACADLSNGATGCSTTVGTAATVNTGTSGATIPLLSTANTWTLGQTLTAGFTSNDVSSVNMDSNATHINLCTLGAGFPAIGFQGACGATTYAIDGDGSTYLALNVPTGGTGFLRVANGTIFQWTATSFDTFKPLTFHGSTSGTLALTIPASGATGTITFPGAGFDFSASGGTSQVVKQTSSGGAFSVAQLACADLSNGATGCSTATGTSGATTPLNNGNNTLSGNDTFSGTVLFEHLAMSATAPTIGTCGGGSPSISAHNGTVAFRVTVGTSTPSACSFSLPTATTGWNCFATDITTNSTAIFVQKMSASSTTSVTITNYSDVAAVTAMANGDVLAVNCQAY